MLLLLAFLTMLCFSWLFFLIPKSQHPLPTLTANNNEKNCINFIFNKFRSSERENPFLLTTILVFCCCLYLVLFLESLLNYRPPYNDCDLLLLWFRILKTRSVGMFLVPLWIPDILRNYLWKFLSLPVVLMGFLVEICNFNSNEDWMETELTLWQ